MTSSKIESVLSKSPLWEEVKEALKRLHQEGWEAVLAGGGVRDALLGKPPKDFDVAVSASPDEVLRIFPRAQGPWKRYGVVFLPLLEKGKTLEITTFRKDQDYKDGRRPRLVEYTSLKEEDAKRRDFTVNALFYDIKSSQVLDFVQGLKDLGSGVLRTVGCPEERFEEDRLRPLRALRFSHQLEFSIEPETGKAISGFAKRLQGVSKERLYDELLKMFLCGRWNKAIKLLHEYAFFDILFPFQKQSVLKDPFLFWNRSFSVNTEPAFIWAVLGLPYFYNCPEEFQIFLKENFKAPSAISKKSTEYIKNVATFLSDKPFVEKLTAFSLGKKQTKELAENFAEAIRHPQRNQIEELFNAFQDREKKEGGLPDPLLTGEDLLKAGYLAGPRLGTLLKKAFSYQIEKKVSQKEEVLSYLLDTEKITNN